MLMKEMFPQVPHDVGFVTCMHTCTCTPSISPFTRPHVVISDLSMHLPPVRMAVRIYVVELLPTSNKDYFILVISYVLLYLEVTLL